MEKKSVHELIETKEFKRLIRRRWILSAILLVFLFFIYYGFILLIALDKAFISQKIGAYTTLGIPLGVLVIILAVILTAIYVIIANKYYDPEVKKLKEKLFK